MKKTIEFIRKTAGRMGLAAVVAVLLWALPAALPAQTYRIGDVVTNADGSQGVVFYLKADGSGGWMVALNDASGGCAWGTAADIPALNNVNPSYYYQQCLADTGGYANTQALRAYQNNSTEYAAGKVDFANGWYLPAAGQLSRLYAMLPDIETALQNAGGTTLGTGIYWTSTENVTGQAWGIHFDYGYFSQNDKTGSCAVRAIRDFACPGIVYDSTLTYAWSTGATTPHIRVTPTATTQYEVTVTTADGCTNTAVQTITVNDPITQTVYDTVCQGEPYAGHGFQIVASETQDGGATLLRSRNVNNCTVLALHLYVSPTPAVDILAQPETICTGGAADLHALGEGAVVSGGGALPAVAIGDILCTDNSTVKPGAYAASGKTAMGVVFYVDTSGRHGWATALQDCSTGCIWGPHTDYSDYTSGDDIPGLDNITNPRTAIADLDGMANTLAIKSHYGSNFASCEAAYNAYYWDHVTSSVGTVAKGWYLPAAGQMRRLWAELYPVNASLTAAGGTQLPVNQSFWYWTSTEYSSNGSWDVSYDGDVTYDNKRDYNDTNRVRAVRAF